MHMLDRYDRLDTMRRMGIRFIWMVPGAENARKIARRWELIRLVGVGCRLQRNNGGYWTQDIIQLMLLNTAGALKLADSRVALRDLNWGLPKGLCRVGLAKEMIRFYRCDWRNCVSWVTYRWVIHAYNCFSEGNQTPRRQRCRIRWCAHGWLSLQ